MFLVVFSCQNCIKIYLDTSRLFLTQPPIRISCLSPMKRILTATVLILAVFGLIFFGNLWMMTLFSVIVAELAAYEYLKLAAVGAEAHDARLRIPIWWMALGTALAFVVTLP